MPSLVILISAILVLSCGQTDTRTQRENHTDVVKYFTAATVGVSNYFV